MESPWMENLLEPRMDEDNGIIVEVKRNFIAF